MEPVKKKQFFAKHAKSSAALISLAIHAIIVVTAASFVAFTVIQKTDQKFEAKKPNRPKMQLKKLQVPVKVKNKAPRPKLRKRIMATPKIVMKTPQVQMPEISGVKSGIGTASGSAFGGSGGIGFSMPEIKIFGIRTRGEKVFLILDSTAWMMVDEIGGIPAYELIKQELVDLLGKLNSTTLFNFAIYDVGSAYVLFPEMVPAMADNVAKVEKWIKHLNSVSENMADNDYGVKTRDQSMGKKIDKQSLLIDPLKTLNDWSSPAMLAMQQQADTIFVLTQGWGHLYHVAEGAKEWSPEKRQKYNALVAKAKIELKNENNERRKKGMPPKVIAGGSRRLVRIYFPSAELPPSPKMYHYTPKEMAEAFKAQRKKAAQKVSTLETVLKKRRDKFSLNVVHFVRKDSDNERNAAKFQELTRLEKGKYKTLAGMDAIRNSSSRANDADN